MGYTTDFKGRFSLDRRLRPEHAAYLRKFSETRRMKRSGLIAARLSDPCRKAARLPLGGEDAPYFVGGLGLHGRDQDVSIREYDRPPSGQPGMRCHWAPSEDDNGIAWDGEEKFCDYVEWLEYIIQHFLKPWGYVLSGAVEWQGERPDDAGIIRVEANDVTASPLLRGTPPDPG